MAWVKDSITEGEIQALKMAARFSWTEDTRYPLALGNLPESGQEYVTACWLKDRLGGKIGRKEGHYVWLSGNEEYFIDLINDRYEANNGAYKSAKFVKNDRAKTFSKRANRAFDNVSSLMKVSIDYMGDAYPGQTPQKALDQEQYYGDEPEYSPPKNEKYNFVYANGDLLVSEDNHEDLLRKVKAETEHVGPMALGYVDVDHGQAFWSVEANVDLKSFQEIARDYSRHLGWRFGGLTNVEGADIAPQFSHRRAKIVRYIVKPNGEVVMGKSSYADIAANIDQGKAGAIKLYGKAAVMTPLIPEAVEGLYEWAKDAGFDLYGRNHMEGPDLELENLGSDDNEIEKTPDDLNLKQLSKEPSGLYKCPSCERLFPNWKEYQKHRKEQEGPAEERMAPEFPVNDMDATFPTHFTEQHPRIMPVARKQAARVDGFMGGSSHDKYFVSYHCGSPVGYARLVDGKVVNMHFAKIREGWEDQLISSIQKFAEKDPKDLLSDSIPFIFDVGEYKIYVGQPGERTSDVEGNFTKGGIVEGIYQPGGKIVLRSETQMPYSVYGLVNLWYYEYPEMSVTGVEIRDEEGGTKKLASGSALDSGNTKP